MTTPIGHVYFLDAATGRYLVVAPDGSVSSNTEHAALVCRVLDKVAEVKS